MSDALKEIKQLQDKQMAIYKEMTERIHQATKKIDLQDLEQTLEEAKRAMKSIKEQIDYKQQALELSGGSRDGRK